MESGTTGVHVDKVGSEASVINGHICGNNRYLSYHGNTGAIGIWDMVTRSTARSSLQGRTWSLLLEHIQ